MKVFDISLPLAPDMPRYPGDPVFDRTVTVAPESNAPFTLSLLTMGSHTGTHIDAPSHLIEGGATIDMITPDQLCGMCRVIYLPGNTTIREMDIVRMGLESCERILFKTDNSLRLGTNSYFSHAVTLEPAAAEKLAEFGPKLVGIDFLSIDAPGTNSFGAHQALLQNDIIILEGVDLQRIDPGEYELYCAPLNIKGGDGAPARVFLCR